MVLGPRYLIGLTATPERADGESVLGWFDGHRRGDPALGPARLERGTTSPFTFLGPVRYESHEKEKPIRIVWKLERPMPPAFWNEIKVAAG